MQQLQALAASLPPPVGGMLGKIAGVPKKTPPGFPENPTYAVTK